MEIRHIDSFLSFYRSVRKRTRAAVLSIPVEHLEWRPRPDLFGPGDLVRHIAAAERWMYVENVLGRPSVYPGYGPELAAGLEGVVAYMDATHEDSTRLLSDLTPEQIQGPCKTVAGSEIPVWLLLRVMIEHEIHHRGQLYSLLGLLGADRPSLFGLTEREVYAAGDG